MTSRNRETLRNYFGDGKLPTRQHFGDLIDSMLNMSDEGFRKSAEKGLEVSTPVGHDALVSFYRDKLPKSVLWSVSYGGGQDMLHFQPGSATGARSPIPVVPVLALDTKARVGINTATPRHALDVVGVVASTGRRGTYKPTPKPIDAKAPEEPKDAKEPQKEVELLADGNWHDITDELKGCQGFEVMAGAGRPGASRFALTHAIALNTYNPTSGWLDFFSRKKRIKQHNAYYGRRCDRLELRWEGTSGKDAAYKLRIRTGCDYGKDEATGKHMRIKVHVTQLWFDETTQGPQA